MRLPLGELGRTAAELALTPDPSPSPRVVTVPGEVVLRESTRPLVG